MKHSLRLDDADVVEIDGTAVVTFTIPSDLKPGSYGLQASGVSGVDESTLTRSAAVSVSNLAYTSAEVAPFVAGAMLLLLAGAGFVLVSRNRRRLAGVTD